MSRYHNTICLVTYLKFRFNEEFECRTICHSFGSFLPNVCQWMWQCECLCGSVCCLFSHFRLIKFITILQDICYNARRNMLHGYTHSCICYILVFYIEISHKHRHQIYFWHREWMKPYRRWTRLEWEFLWRMENKTKPNHQTNCLLSFYYSPLSLLEHSND